MERLGTVGLGITCFDMCLDLHLSSLRFDSLKADYLGFTKCTSVDTTKLTDDL